MPVNRRSRAVARGHAGAGQGVVCLFAAVAALLGAMGCATGPSGPPPTLLVTNATCNNGGMCRSLQIRAFVNAFTVPGQPPTGFEVLGYASGPTACLTFPRSWRLGITDAGNGQTTFITWTPDNPSGISLFAVDSVIVTTGGTIAEQDSATQGVWPFEKGSSGTIGSTESFVPGNAAGWSVTFPLRGRGGAVEPGLTQGRACTVT